MFEVPAYSSDPQEKQKQMGQMLAWLAGTSRAPFAAVEQELTQRVREIVDALDFNIALNRVSLSHAIKSSIHEDRVEMLELLIPKYKIAANGDWETPTKESEEGWEIYWPFVPSAVSAGSPAAAKVLLDAGASPDKTGLQGKPPLVVALYRYMVAPEARGTYLSHEKATQLANLLLDYNADPTVRGAKFKFPGSALSIARSVRDEIDPDLYGRIEAAAAKRPASRRGFLARLAA